jgi:hypothetical protein
MQDFELIGGYILVQNEFLPIRCQRVVNYPPRSGQDMRAGLLVYAEAAARIHGARDQQSCGARRVSDDWPSYVSPN